MSAPKYWREIPHRYRFEAVKCKKCGKVLFPSRLACPQCKAREFDQVRISDKGRIETFTIVRIAPTGFTDEAPYPVAVVDMGDGVRVLCQVADIELEELKIGMPVRLEFRLIQKEGPAGILAYGYKCVPE